MAKVSQSGGTILDRIVDFIIPSYIVDFLNQTLFRSWWIIINYWSFVHFLSGIVFYVLFPNKFLLWIIINVVFEILEFILALGGNPLFVEEGIDIFWDIIWSILGFLIVKYIVVFITKHYS